MPETFELCTDLIRPGGRVANVGVHGHSATLHLEKLWIRDVLITTGLVDTTTTPKLLRLIETGRLDPTAFATHRFALDDTEQAYDVFGAAAESHALKVVLEAPSGGARAREPARGAGQGVGEARQKGGRCERGRRSSRADGPAARRARGGVWCGRARAPRCPSGRRLTPPRPCVPTTIRSASTSSAASSTSVATWPPPVRTSSVASIPAARSSSTWPPSFSRMSGSSARTGAPPKRPVSSSFACTATMREPWVSASFRTSSSAAVGELGAVGSPDDGLEHDLRPFLDDLSFDPIGTASASAAAPKTGA